MRPAAPAGTQGAERPEDDRGKDRQAEVSEVRDAGWGGVQGRCS